MHGGPAMAPNAPQHGRTSGRPLGGAAALTGSAGTVTREADNRLIFKEIGEFLGGHHLFPSPGNYALIFHIITEPDSPAAQAVQALIGDGLRLSQQDADMIREEFGLDPGGPSSSPTSETLTRARRQIDNFATVVETARAETEAYGADLGRGAEELGRLAVDHPAVGEVVRITGAMIERTRTTEAQLDSAREEAKALREKLAAAEEEARLDPLTRLPNRRAFEDKLAETMASGIRASLAICDVDRFKSINDSHGHAVGDRVLRMVADVLRGNCAGHMVARIGGEEFVVLFEGVETDAAGAVLDAARQDLASRNFRVRGTDVPLGRVTFSAGVARCVDCDGEAPLKRADDLLYRAKNGGRNQVIVEAA